MSGMHVICPQNKNEMGKFNMNSSLSEIYLTEPLEGDIDINKQKH